MRLVAIGLCLALAGCMTTESQIERINAQRAATDQECRSKGYKPGSQDYQTCVALVGQQHAAVDSAVQGVGWTALGAGVMLLPALLSDARLKEDVVKVWELEPGIGLYRFRYKGEQQQYVGVLAQEVQKKWPEAVSKDEQGYLRVDYGRMYWRMYTWEEWQKKR